MERLKSWEEMDWIYGTHARDEKLKKKLFERKGEKNLTWKMWGIIWKRILKKMWVESDWQL